MQSPAVDAAETRSRIAQARARAAWDAWRTAGGASTGPTLDAARAAQAVADRSRSEAHTEFLREVAAMRLP